MILPPVKFGISFDPSAQINSRSELTIRIGNYVYNLVKTKEAWVLFHRTSPARTRFASKLCRFEFGDENILSGAYHHAYEHWARNHKDLLG